jgi:hypothetical protein
LNVLTINSRLQTAAQWKADDMIQKDYWEHFHNGKSPWDWMKEADYDYIDAGENLAIDFTELEPMMTAWMNSRTHRDNILNSKYKEIGIGIGKGDFEGHQTIIVVQMFGNPALEKVAQKNEISSTPSSYEPTPEQKQFTTSTPEDLSKKEVAQVENQSQETGIKGDIDFIKNIFVYLFKGYKTNVQRGYVQFRSIILQNYSASANN